MAEQVLKKSGAPFCRRRGPGNFQTARDGVCSFARAETVLPTKTLCIESRRFGFRTHVARSRGAVRFSKGVTARDKRYRFLVVHPHAFERFPDVNRRECRVRVTVRAFWVD